VSSLGRIAIHFVEPGVKFNGAYYRNVLLMQKLLPDIQEFSEYYTFQQDVAPAHRARDTAELLTKETPDFIPLHVAFKYPRPKSGGLQNLGYNARKSL